MAGTESGLLLRLRYIGEYGAIRAISAVVGLLPEKLAEWAGVALGATLWLFAFGRRRIARRNIEKAMPGELTGREVRRLVRRAFLHVGLTAVETLWTRKRVTKENIEERFPVDGLGPIMDALAKGRGLIAVGMHLGNWELFGGCMAARLKGLGALARPVNNPLVRKYTTRLREQMGIEVLSTRDGVRPMLRALKENRPLGVLIDQHVNRAFVPVKFFGREAATTAVAAALALRTEAAVFVGYSLRDGYTFRHHGYFEGPMELIRTGDHEADVAANTQMFNDKLEEIIRRHPEQWLWTHRRWKLAERMGRQKESSADVA